jgi:hypothetical protein
MRLIRLFLLAATAFGFLYACSVVIDLTRSRYTAQQEPIAIAVAGALALNFYYLLLCSPAWERSRLRRLLSLWYEAKERELRLRGYPKNSN